MPHIPASVFCVLTQTCSGLALCSTGARVVDTLSGRLPVACVVILGLPSARQEARVKG